MAVSECSCAGCLPRPIRGAEGCGTLGGGITPACNSRYFPTVRLAQGRTAPIFGNSSGQFGICGSYFNNIRRGLFRFPKKSLKLSPSLGVRPRSIEGSKLLSLFVIAQRGSVAVLISEQS